MLNFVFLLALNGSFYVEDYNLTGRDCIDLVAEYFDTDPAMTRGIPSCELAPYVAL